MLSWAESRPLYFSTVAAAQKFPRPAPRVGYLSAKVRWRNSLNAHIAGQGGSYTAMTTALLVVNWENLSGCLFSAGMGSAYGHRNSNHFLAHARSRPRNSASLYSMGKCTEFPMEIPLVSTLSKRFWGIHQIIMVLSVFLTSHRKRLSQKTGMIGITEKCLAALPLSKRNEVP